MTVTDTIIRDNISSAPGGTAQGGAIASNAKLSVTRTRIIGNHAAGPVLFGVGRSGVPVGIRSDGRQELTTWAARIAKTWPDDAKVFAYFNNTPGGAAVLAAVLDATTFVRAFRAAGRTALGPEKIDIDGA
jgi:hypothetical protein